MVLKTYNIALFVVVGLIMYLVHIEYGITFTKPVYAIIGFVIVKLWLRTVSTATYILVHLVFFAAAYFWVKHFLDTVSAFDMVAIATELMKEAGMK